MSTEKDSIEIKIDGETLSFKLSASQKAQLKRATKKVTDYTPPPSFGHLTLACKNPRGTYPMVIMYAGEITSYKIKGFTDSLIAYRGRDFSFSELKSFIGSLKAYAMKVWPAVDFTDV